jgi:hypothetical protein
VKLFKAIKEYINRNPKVKKAIGVTLILIGLVSLLTPLTPGSWLAIIGLELLGVRILFLDKFKFWNWNWRKKKKPEENK